MPALGSNDAEGFRDLGPPRDYFMIDSPQYAYSLWISLKRKAINLDINCQLYWNLIGVFSIQLACKDLMYVKKTKGLYAWPASLLSESQYAEDLA